MSNQIPVLYTEQKRKKAKLWLDGYLVPRATLNSARLISAGKHEIDVVFYSSIDDLKPGREFETDRYLISIEERDDGNQPCPRPSFAVNDPTMRNRPKSGAFVPPRLVPKPDPRPPSPPPASTFMPALERHNPNQWGYAGMTTAMKRTVENSDTDYDSSHTSKLLKSSNSVSNTFQQRRYIEPEEQQTRSLLPTYSPPAQQQQQPGLLNAALISKLLNNTRPPNEIKSSPVKQAPLISWSSWDDKKSDDEDSEPTSTPNNENALQQPLPTKQTFNWHTLVKSAGEHRPIEDETKTSETMPKFEFDESSFDTLFDNADE